MTNYKTPGFHVEKINRVVAGRAEFQQDHDELCQETPTESPTCNYSEDVTI